MHHGSSAYCFRLPALFRAFSANSGANGSRSAPQCAFTVSIGRERAGIHTVYGMRDSPAVATCGADAAIVLSPHDRIRRWIVARFFVRQSSPYFK